MIKKKPITTRTYGQLHFEDLDPHRFEDLIRGLLYDFKAWQSVEATGGAGSDDGFDMRAWERVTEITNEDEEDGSEGSHPMEGNLWMIQCKRSKTLGPKKVKSIIEENVNKKDSIYGYILVAPTKFSKQSYDVFREELSARGIKEYYIWGNAELEDQLFMPKNDHLLFAFFGFSLITRKRSKKTELKFVINNKNKLLKLLGNNEHNRSMHEYLLIRDFNDTKYPYRKDYSDFGLRPRWKSYLARRLHPTSLQLDVSEYYAYYDEKSKTFDVVNGINLLTTYEDIHDTWEREKLTNKELVHKEEAESYWKHLPNKNKALIKIKGYLKYEDILVIDDKGDALYQCPHLFVDYSVSKSPFYGTSQSLKTFNGVQDIASDFERKPYFPNVFPKIIKGNKIPGDELKLDKDRMPRNQDDFSVEVFGFANDLISINPYDILVFEEKEKGLSPTYFEVTHKYTYTYATLLERKEGYANAVKYQLGTEPQKTDNITVLEVFQRYFL